MGKGFQNLEINVLRGLDRNKATGDDPDGAPLPTAAYNLAPNRRGALTAFGRNAQHVVDGSPATLPGTLIGFDERGFASLDRGSNAYRLYDGFRRVDGALTYEAGTIQDSAHVHGFGAYRSRSQFLGYDDSGEGTRVEPFTLRPTLVGEEGGALTTATFGGTPFIAVAVDGENDRWMAVTSDGDTWVSDGADQAFVAATGIGTTGVRSLAYGDGVWVAAGTNGIRYSSDFGATWSAGTTGNVYKVVWSGSVFNAIREIATNQSEVIRSADGTGWTNAGALQESGVGTAEGVWGGIAFSESGLGLIVTTTNRGATSSQRKTFLSENGGTTWAHQNLTGNYDKIASNPVVGLAGGPITSFWVVNNTGAIIFLPDARTPSANSVAWDPAGDPSRYALSAHYDFTRRKWYAVMADGSFWESDNGTSLRRVTEMDLDAPPQVGGLAPQLVTSSDQAVMVVGNDGGAGGVRVTGATLGLEAGTHRVYWVTSVSTNAGLVVVDIGSQYFAFEGSFGAFVQAEIPSVADILDTMAWVNDGDPVEVAEVEELLRERTFVDIYVSYSDVTPGDADEAETQDPLEEVVPIYAFTLRPKDAPDAPRRIPNNPVGRILGSGDGVMTMGLQAGSAVVHSDRVWGIASSDETLYSTPNDGVATPEAASVRGATVVAYSDVGYVNLMRQGSYVTIVPAESDQFVGMVSTPSGLLVFFNNEVYLIAGDPALGNVAVELYPDIVGADPGTRPTKMGGVAFTVWRGDIYALAGGQAQALSKPAYIREDPFVEVIAEPCNRCVLGRTESGRVFRYFLEHQQWFDNTLQTFDYMLPNPQDCSLGVRYVVDEDVWVVRRDGNPDTPYLTYRNIDYGDKNRVDSTYGMMAPTTGDFDDDNLPRLYFKILEGQDDVEDPGSTDYVDAHREEGMFRFYIPRGHKARLWDFRLLLRGMAYGDTLEPQVVIEWVPGHRAIRRPSSGGGGDPILVM